MKQQAADIDKIAVELAGGRTLEQLRASQNRFARKFEPTTVATNSEVGAEYLKRVFAPVTRNFFSIRKLEQEMSYEEARKAVWYLMGQRAHDISQLEGRDFEWLLSDGDKFRIVNLIKYFINDPSGAYAINKGLFFCGMPGTGKTEMMKIMQSFANAESLTKKFEYTNLSDVHTKAKVDKAFDPITPFVTSNRCFDEFGRHLGAINRFGTDINITEALIEGRYDRRTKYGQFTFCIANMTIEECRASFPPMVYDRLKSMCAPNVIVFNGSSKRQ